MVGPARGAGRAGALGVGGLLSWWLVWQHMQAAAGFPYLLPLACRPLSLLLFPLCSLHTCSLFSLSHYIFVAVFQLILRYFRILTFTSFLLQFPTSIFPYTSLPNCFDCTSHLLWHNKIRHPPHISNHIFVFQTCFVLTLPIRGDHIPKPLRFSRGCTPG